MFAYVGPNQTLKDLKDTGMCPIPHGTGGEGRFINSQTRPLPEKKKDDVRALAARNHPEGRFILMERLALEDQLRART